MTRLSAGEREEMGLMQHDRWCSRLHLAPWCDCNLPRRRAAAELILAEHIDEAVERLRRQMLTLADSWHRALGRTSQFELELRQTIEREVS